MPVSARYSRRWAGGASHLPRQALLQQAGQGDELLVVALAGGASHLPRQVLLQQAGQGDELLNVALAAPPPAPGGWRAPDAAALIRGAPIAL